ncbi:MAG: hypothetical protein HC790_07985 [Acaryochloridaceae cyanobacterium CSU_3_4]|nr:hypothetical protein [Acaryochloridaceae cyanobacterium CSU_3_4]
MDHEFINLYILALTPSPSPNFGRGEPDNLSIPEQLPPRPVLGEGGWGVRATVLLRIV